ncbi:MAG: hypothetical protein MJZ85_09750 [Bacteroidales bacterium]|nr:hypothetical protein [Bacteroidales bacterium]
MRKERGFLRFGRKKPLSQSSKGVVIATERSEWSKLILSNRASLRASAASGANSFYQTVRHCERAQRVEQTNVSFYKWNFKKL